MRGEDLIFLGWPDIAGLTRGRGIPVVDLEARMHKGIGWVPVAQALTPFSTLAPNPWGPMGDIWLVPDLDGERFVATPRYYSLRRGLTLRLTVAGAEPIETPAADGVPVALPLADVRPWSPDDPHLYDVKLELLDGQQVLDEVSSYAGLRKVHIEGNRVFLNNAPLYQRLVLDQGFYAKGIWTAPSDEALRADMELSLAAGFNADDQGAGFGHTGRGKGNFHGSTPDVFSSR